MKRMMNTVALVFLVCVLSSGSTFAETFIITDSLVLSGDNIELDDDVPLDLATFGIASFNDTTVVSSFMGLLIKTSDQANWEILLRTQSWGEVWYDEYKRAQKHQTLYWPSYVYRIPDSDELLVFDNYMGAFYIISLTSRKDLAVRFEGFQDRLSRVDDIKIIGDRILYSLMPGKQDSLIGISDLDRKSYHRMYTSPVKLVGILDSLGADLRNYNAWNPNDSTIYLAYKYYNKVYKISVDGILLDSIAITASDFRIPQPPKSRIKSAATFEDWVSKCTEVGSLEFAPPNYLLLQYFKQIATAGGDSLWLSPTLVWKTDKTPVELDIDQTWRQIQTLPDGRIVFAKDVRRDGVAKKVTLYFIRIIA